MKKSMWFFSLGFAIAAGAAMADDPPAAQPTPAQQKTMHEVRAACQADVQKLCATVQPGGGRIVACLKEHKEEVSDACKQAIGKAKQNQG
jgi:D-serine deaminase-like pyridoxal phosphate-dependent protein